MSKLARASSGVTELALKALAVGLERGGWTPTEFDVDFSRCVLRIQLKRMDGRLVTLRADQRSVTVTREHQGVAFGLAPNLKGKHARSDYVAVEFLERQRFEGPHVALRALCRYVADNPPEGLKALGEADVRRLFVPFMASEWGSALALKKADTESAS